MPAPTIVTTQQLARRIGLPDAPILLDVRTAEDAAEDPRFLPGSQRRTHDHVAAWAADFAGQDVVVTLAVKPTSSILNPRQSVSAAGEDVDVLTRGRHDPCVGIRAVPVGEAKAMGSAARVSCASSSSSATRRPRWL